MQAIQERNIDWLLKENKEEIDLLREKVKDVIDESHDDIFLLRYVLSYERYNDDWKRAADAIRFTIDYRKENHSWLSKARTEGLDSAPYIDIVKKYAVSTIHKTSKQGGPLLILRTGLADGIKLMEELNPEQVANFLIYQDEYAYLQCDKIAREERRLVKLIVINDMKGFSLMNSSRIFFEALGISSKISEKIFPQLLEKSVAVNPKFIYKTLISLASYVVPKKTMEKFQYCPYNDIKNGDISKCPFAKEYLTKENLPTFLGGTCVCKDKKQFWGCDGCIDGIDNDATEHPVKTLVKMEKDELKKEKKQSQKKQKKQKQEKNK